MEDILVIGAFDRNNYGDLLFPLIIEKQLTTYNPNFKFEFFGLVDSDLSGIGGKRTLNISEFYDRCKNGNQKVNVILAGGESVAVKWGSLISAIDGHFKIDLIRFFTKYLAGFINFDRYGIKFLGLHSPFPFLITKDEFPNVHKVILNSLGGSRVNEKLLTTYKVLREALVKSDYFAVRDNVTLGNLKRNGIDAHLYPDSAILMSEFYSQEFLSRNVSKKTAEYVSKKKGQYAFVQVGKRISKGFHKQIADGINKIHSDYKVDICLCPIGKALAHEDDIALHEVSKHLTVPYELFVEVNIWDIMYLIANAKTYVGTSLHGVITAMSYTVPYVGLKGAKVNSYMSTWGVDGLNKVSDFNEIITGYSNAQKVTKESLIENRNRQLVKIRESFDNMAKLIEN